MMNIRSTDRFEEITWILRELERRLPRLRGSKLYERSIPHYLASGAYKFFVVTEKTGAGTLDDSAAFGFVTFYPAPMNNGLILAVEAFWFRDERLEAQLPVWSLLVGLARKMEFRGVCIAHDSVNTPASLEALLNRGTLDGDPVLPDTIGLKPDVGDIYSAFHEGPLPAHVFLASCLRIYPQELVGHFAGVPSRHHRFFYRGEGRLTRWGCRYHQELAELFLKQGFPTRGHGTFSGTLQEQILQQGHVDQPTVSLTDSFDVAAVYATYNGPGEKLREGVVFTIDADRLQTRGEVFDSYASMVLHCEPELDPRSLNTLRMVVEGLGVLEAGRFLERCDTEARKNAFERGGLRRPLEAIEWRAYISDEHRDELARAKVQDSALSLLCQAMEGFWMMAATPLGSATAVTVRNDSVEEEPLRLDYYLAFHQVQARLEAEPGNLDPNRGWDVTPFGYIAKTCRDREFFSSGPIPGECVVSATLVDETRAEKGVLASR